MNFKIRSEGYGGEKKVEQSAEEAGGVRPEVEELELSLLLG